ncbi:olfactory receptor 6B1-like [Protobothrops mucrosquamatus]|uniref:olfactory receptor 6B1-like n=1 Tax=Protobothrops mucrosquamatus TaxID=103944 RepID=UPI0007759830|nr:olfactory receptor 6B1-like [Protobothrops mucrosquamatus]
MKKIEWRNETIITEFILHGFGDLKEIHILLFILFLIIYIMTMAGNLLIIALIVTDQHLHTPMYFFLGNLSCLETCYSSTILPRILVSLLNENYTVSVNGCILQLWAFVFLAVTECYLLAAMSYDRYLAICRPLHYSTLMNFKICLQLVVGSWIGSFVIDTILLTFILKLSFCGHNLIEHFFCDFIPMMNLACSDASQVKLVSAILTSISTLPPFFLTIISYAYIIAAILGIPSIIGRQKAFSICSSHLIVVTIFYGSLTVVYLLQDSNELRELNKIFSVFYTILTPLFNPLIYSLRNKEVRGALGRTVSKYTTCIQVH